MVDTARGDEWRHESVPLLRQSSDDAAVPGESSLNPEDFWRRQWSSWHKGAGQIHRDREESSPFRFQESRGIDVWNRYELSLLPDVDQKRTSSSTNLKLMPCGSRLFLVDGADVVYTEDITVDSPTWTACTNEPGGTILDIASDGKYVWITDGSNSYWADSTASPPAFNLPGWTGSQDVDVFDYVKGYLVGGHDNTLHYYDASGAATAITIAARLPSSFDFVGFAGGPTTAVIYAAGFAGDKSTIFRIGIKDDGSGLDVAIPAAELPDGEIVRSIYSYLGFVMIGTDEGVRFATPDANGDLTLGALLETGSPCRCFEGQGPHVWFGWDTFTESSVGTVLTGEDWHGLGRLSLEEFSSADRLAPAYATDLMVANLTGGTSSVVTFQGLRVFCVEGTSQGVFAQESGPGTSGYMLTGLTDFGFTGNKTTAEIDLAYQLPSGAVLGMQVEADDTGVAGSVGTLTAEGEGVQTFTTGQLVASRFNTIVYFVLGSATTSPTITSFTLKATPAVKSTSMIRVPLLFEEWVDPDGSVNPFDVEGERNNVEGWWETRQPITYSELGRTHTVIVWNRTWLPRVRESDLGGFTAAGTMILDLKEV